MRLIRVNVTALASLACLASTAIVDLPAQMSGDYTIDVNGTGSRNYASFQTAIYDLWQLGMNGAVTITVAPGFYQQAVLVPIRGMSAKTPLTFKAKNRHLATLTRPGWGAAFTIDLSTASNPVEGLVFDGIQFASAYRGIHAKSPTTDLEIRDCRFAASVNGISIEGSAQRWNIHHCLFDMKDQSAQPVRLVSCDDVSFHHNEVRISKSRGVEIASTSKLSGVKPTRIYNNVISGSPNSSYPPIHLGVSAHGVEVSHNSVLVTGNSAFLACIRLGGHFTNPNKVLNNIFVRTYVSQPAVIVEALSSFDYQMDGNLYYKTGGTVFEVYRGPAYTTLGAWQQASGQDKFSLFADPRFQGGLASPFDLHLLPNSPAVGKAVASPFYVTDDFDGNPRGSRVDIGAYQAQLPFMKFGRGCAGTLGNVPSIGSTGSPRIGSNDFTVTLGNALGGSGVKAWLIVGGSNEKWGSIPLPLPFGGGCTLLVSADLLLRLDVGGSGPGNGSASVKMVIPNNPKLIGTRTYFQWGVVDPAAKGIGLAFSDGGILSL